MYLFLLNFCSIFLLCHVHVSLHVRNKNNALKLQQVVRVSFVSIVSNVAFCLLNLLYLSYRKCCGLHCFGANILFQPTDAMQIFLGSIAKNYSRHTWLLWFTHAAHGENSNSLPNTSWALSIWHYFYRKCDLNIRLVWCLQLLTTMM